MRTVVVTGSASGMGAASKQRLEGDGHRVIGVDRRDADVVADLSIRNGRDAAIAGVLERAGEQLDGAVTWAGMAGLTDADPAVVVSVNFFGTVDLLDAFRPLLARGDEPAVVAVGSNSSTTFPGIPLELTHACLDRDEDHSARAMAREVGPARSYAASKLAVPWWVRRNAPEWAADGITLNALVPGVVSTPMVAQLEADELIGPHMDLLPIPVGRRGRADEEAAMASFLLGPDARFVCGSVIFVDGGSDALLAPDAQPAPPLT